MHIKGTELEAQRIFFYDYMMVKSEKKKKELTVTYVYMTKRYPLLDVRILVTIPQEM